MQSKYGNLCDAFRACGAEAKVQAITTTKLGTPYEVAGTIPTTMHPGCGNAHHIEYRAWFLGRGRGLNLEAVLPHSLPPRSSYTLFSRSSESVLRKKKSVGAAITHANNIGHWITRFYLEGDAVVARMATVLPADKSMPEGVRVLIDDFTQAINDCFNLFAVASRSSEFLPQLLDDPNFVVELLRTGLAHKPQSGGESIDSTVSGDLRTSEAYQAWRDLEGNDEGDDRATDSEDVDDGEDVDDQDDNYDDDEDHEEDHEEDDEEDEDDNPPRRPSIQRISKRVANPIAGLLENRKKH
jgi:hypothetical protein